MSRVRSGAKFEARRRLEREQFLEQISKTEPPKVNDPDFKCQCLTAEARHHCPDWQRCTHWR